MRKAYYYGKIKRLEQIHTKGEDNAIVRELFPRSDRDLTWKPALLSCFPASVYQWNTFMESSKYKGHMPWMPEESFVVKVESKRHIASKEWMAERETQGSVSAAFVHRYKATNEHEKEEAEIERMFTNMKDAGIRALALELDEGMDRVLELVCAEWEAMQESDSSLLEV
jgi:hypothetical protein